MLVDLVDVVDLLVLYGSQLLEGLRVEFDEVLALVDVLVLFDEGFDALMEDLDVVHHILLLS